MYYQGQPSSVFQVYIVIEHVLIVLLGTAILSLSGTYRIVIEHVLLGKVILRLPGIVIEHVLVLSGTAIHRLPGIVK